uniref:Peptidase S8/S53 domain-containing protein n=1 Tax=Eiseniibacteriota bacterium TaxID=2212470 RepID=A0A832MJZ9_UNCEI
MTTPDRRSVAPFAVRAVSRPRRAAAPAAALLAAALLAGPAVAPAAAAASPGLAPSLARRAAETPEQPVVAWVRFTDRAGAERRPEALEAARRALPARSLERRARRGTARSLGAADLPVHAPYVAAVTARGARVRGASRWLNAVSVEMPARLAPELARLPFVAAVEPVPAAARTRRAPEPEAPAAAASVRPAAAGAAQLAPGEQAWYGGAFRQLDMMQVPAVHAAGLSGAGVLVCVLDSGFRTTHRAFDGLDLVAARDFVHGDAVVDDEPGQDPPGAASHGTQTLGCIAGRLPGVYAGGAFGASVALGKTEDVASETPVEMDYWLFGAEWADSLGADVLSSSLGYFTFDDPLDSYAYDDMDGRTTVVTLAAAEAARRGITVVTAAGNEGGTAWHHIIAPADADTVIAVGAVDSFNVVTSFSSRGPSADGRIKPDVTAMGRRVLCVSFGNDSTYARVSGTSFSTPLVAGVVALLLEAHPTWGPFEVREALRETALNHATPDNDIGWGLVQADLARAWIPSTLLAAPPAPAAPGAAALAAAPNPLLPGAALTVRFTAPDGARARLDVLDLAGRRVARLHDGPARGPMTATWRATGADGARVPPGAYWLRLAADAPGAPGRVAARRVVVLD